MKSIFILTLLFCATPVFANKANKFKVQLIPYPQDTEQCNPGYMFPYPQLSIADSGQVIAYCIPKDGDSFSPFLWSAREGWKDLREVLKFPDLVTALTSPKGILAGLLMSLDMYVWQRGAPYSIASQGTYDPCAVNDKKEISGIYESGVGTLSVFYWSKSKGFKKLGAVSRGSRVTGMNNRGEIIGYDDGYSGELEMSTAFQTGLGKPIRPIGDPEVFWNAQAISDTGQIVGGCWSPQNEMFSTPCSFQHGKISYFDLSIEGSAKSVNTRGEVILEDQYYYSPTQPATDVLDLVVNKEGIDTLFPAQINNMGEIVGDASLKAGPQRAVFFIARPVTK